jgi:outer membrane protein assembly factor BamB
MTALPKSLLLSGIKGHVIALDKATGSERWRTRLKGAQFVHLVTDGNVVFASTSGEVFALDAATGTILWNNPLKTMGLGLVSLLAGGAPGDALFAEESRRAQARSQAAAG